MKQHIINTRYRRRCKQRLSSVLQYIYKITNKQAGALKHSSQIFWRLIAIVLIVAKTLLEYSTAIMPMVIYRKEKNIMTRKIKITNSNTEPAHALNAQANGIYPYGFPFTLNLTMGCSYGCKYCYSPITLRKVIENKRDNFFMSSIYHRRQPWQSA